MKYGKYNAVDEKFNIFLTDFKIGCLILKIKNR